MDFTRFRHLQEAGGFLSASAAVPGRRRPPAAPLLVSFRVLFKLVCY